jgi:hypothetical protein
MATIARFATRVMTISFTVFGNNVEEPNQERHLNDKTLNLVQIEGFLCGADGGHSEP